MRVIAGTARHLKLKTVEGLNTRPTTDRIKETLFNMLSWGIEDSCFLDLFAGSGAIGIEALSRGASRAVFVENHRKALSCIRENLAHTHLADGAVIYDRDVLSALSMMDREYDHFDYIFMDPPYGKEWEKKVLSLLMEASFCDEDTIIIVESDLDTTFSYLEVTNLKVDREKIYKTNKNTFIKKEVKS